MSQLESADRQEPPEAMSAKIDHLKQNIAGQKQEMLGLSALDIRMKAAPDQQISLTDPDARSMATSGRGSGMVGYNVQVAVETGHHLIIAHEVTNVGNDRMQLAPMAEAAKAALNVETLDAIADRGYFNSEQIKQCADAGVTATLPKPQTSSATADGRFGRDDFVYLSGQDVYRCPANQLLPHRYTTIELGLKLHRYWREGIKIAKARLAEERPLSAEKHTVLLSTCFGRSRPNPGMGQSTMPCRSRTFEKAGR